MYDPVDELAEEVIDVLRLRNELEWQPEWVEKMRQAVRATLAADPDMPYGDFSRNLRQELRNKAYDAVFAFTVKVREARSNTGVYELSAAMCVTEMRLRRDIKTWPRVKLSVCGYPVYGRIMPADRNDIELEPEEHHVLFEERITPEKVGKPRGEWPQSIGELGGLVKASDFVLCEDA